MGKKKELLKELEVLTNVAPQECLVEEETDDEIVASKVEPMTAPVGVIKPPRKKLPPKTACQLAVLEKGRLKMIENARLKRIEKEATASVEREILETKIVKKALKIKRREIKQHAVVETSDEDDEPIQAVKKVATKRVRIQEPEQQYAPPSHNFFFV